MPAYFAYEMAAPTKLLTRGARTAKPARIVSSSESFNSSSSSRLLRRSYLGFQSSVELDWVAGPDCVVEPGWEIEPDCAGGLVRMVGSGSALAVSTSHRPAALSRA